MEQQHKKPSPARPNFTAFAVVFLGICFIVSAFIISGKLGALNKTFEGKTFFSPSSSNISVNGGIENQTYLTQSEAAQYLHMTEADIADMLDKQQLFGYFKTSSGEIIIARKSLDDWFSTHQAKPAKAAE